MKNQVVSRLEWKGRKNIDQLEISKHHQLDASKNENGLKISRLSQNIYFLISDGVMDEFYALLVTN